MPAPYLAANGATILMIGGADQVFHQRVKRSLDKINQTVAGQALLGGILANRVAGKNVGIVPNAPQGGSECACVSPHSNVTRTLLAQAVFDNPAGFRVELAACLGAAGHANDAVWLANAINAAPVYDIVGVPNVAPSGLGVTQQQVTAWLNGTVVFPLPFAGAQINRLERALLVALWPGARLRPGAGGHSQVRWRKESDSIGLTTGVRQTRSKSIGLAHELVHAYYNGAGLQMGLDNPLAVNGVPQVTSAALFEYMCVGLGIWAAEPFSENAIRAQWANVIKYTLFGDRTKVRYGAVAPRPAY